MPTEREEELARRIAELEAQNARLRESLDFVKAERKELREELYGPVEPFLPEEELIELVNERMRNHDPERGRKFVEEIEALARGQT
jgi:hypothetical protein